MVHTEPFAARHLAHLPDIATAALSDAATFLHMRPRHAEYPESASLGYLQKIRVRVVSPDTVIRVAVADDTDPFTDLWMGSDGLWMRGRWEKGVWVENNSILPEAERKVAEGRVVGYSIWTRTWPSDLNSAAMAKKEAGDTWPRDSLFKSPDRAVDPVLRDTMRDRLMGQYSTHSQRVKDQVKSSKGWIYCAAVAVDPAFQRQGIGARMMRWGIERAEKEQVPILLIASSKGSLLYKRLGFETLGIMTIADDASLVDEAMVYWPKGFTNIEASSLKAVRRGEAVSPEVSAAAQTNSLGAIV